MQVIAHQKENKTKLNHQWIRRAGTAGFVFFIAKGMVWIVAAVWVVY